MTTFYVRQNDTLPALTRTLQYKDDAGAWQPIDLTTAVGVTFRMRHSKTGSPKVEAACTIVTADEGVVRYNWQSGDTDAAGAYRAEFEIDFGGGNIQTVPNRGQDTVVVTEELD